MNGGLNKKNIEQENSITRRRETGFEVSLKQEAMMKIPFENKWVIGHWKEKKQVMTPNLTELKKHLDFVLRHSFPGSAIEQVHEHKTELRREAEMEKLQLIKMIAVNVPPEWKEEKESNRRYRTPDQKITTG
ncbi:hypothetical protein HGM15179_010688 [Zosterops borbonicus]|uniref:Uncharacterized protein n=1 Tax=Zosterops borbonicus TaxID=364589 RepID=A0A8K1GDJ2_9PASS|nr:hypothetical protein HGM15179_010688 [Zosterops borbonicus]